MLKTLKTEKNVVEEVFYKIQMILKNPQIETKIDKTFKNFQFLCYFCQVFNTFWGLERVNVKNNEK